MKRLRVSLVLFLVVVLLASACGDKDKSPEVRTVKVAVALPTDFAPTQHMYQGIQLALEEAGGKAGEVKVEIVPFKTSQGDEYSVELEAQAARTAVADKNVVAYIGITTSGQGREAIPILNEGRLVGISATATWPGLTKTGYGAGEPGIYYPTGLRTFFRLTPADDAQGKAGASWIREMGYQKIYIIDDGSPYGTGVAGIFEVAAVDLKLDVIAHDHFDFQTETPETYAQIAQRIVDAQPDAVYFGGYATEGGSTLIGALRTLDPDLPFVGSDGIVQHPSIIEENGAELVEGVYATDVAVPPEAIGTESANDFITRYQAKYQEDPLNLSVMGYEAMQVVLYAIAQADEPTRANVLDEISNLGQFNGLLGSWSFDDNGDITSGLMSGWTIENGQWKFVKVLR